MTQTLDAAADTAPWTAQQILYGLFNHLAGQGWAPLTEVTYTPPASWGELSAARGIPEQWESMKARRIDMLALRRPRNAAHGTLERLAIEVKVSRADFLSDVRNPHKQAAWRELSERHVYAAPAGLIDPAEVPAGSGLLAVTRWVGHPETPPQVQWAKRAPRNPNPPQLPDWMVLSFAHRAAWAEAAKKGLTFTSAKLNDDPDELRGEILRLRAELERAQKAREKAVDLAESWREAFAHGPGIPCHYCEKPLTPHRPNGGSWRQWKHSKADEAACLPVRAAAARYSGAEPFPVPVFREDES